MVSFPLRRERTSATEIDIGLSKFRSPDREAAPRPALTSAIVSTSFDYSTLIGTDPRGRGASVPPSGAGTIPEPPAHTAKALYLISSAAPLFSVSPALSAICSPGKLVIKWKLEERFTLASGARAPVAALRVEAGDFFITAPRGEQSGSVAVTVEEDECHVITQELTLGLEPETLDDRAVIPN
jgi:hypothetical protein